MIDDAQGQRLIPDPYTGRSTCQSNRPSTLWHFDTSSCAITTALNQHKTKQIVISHFIYQSKWELRHILRCESWIFFTTVVLVSFLLIQILLIEPLWNCVEHCVFHWHCGIFSLIYIVCAFNMCLT